MPNPYKYPWEKFHGATRALAAGDGTPKERLIMAAKGLLFIQHACELPKDIDNRHQALREALTISEAQGDEGKIAATVNKMPDEEVRRHIYEIVSIYDLLCRNMPVR